VRERKVEQFLRLLRLLLPKEELRVLEEAGRVTIVQTQQAVELALGALRLPEEFVLVGEPCVLLLVRLACDALQDDLLLGSGLLATDHDVMVQLIRLLGDQLAQRLVLLLHEELIELAVELILLVRSYPDDAARLVEPVLAKPHYALLQPLLQYLVLSGDIEVVEELLLAPLHLRLLELV